MTSPLNCFDSRRESAPPQESIIRSRYDKSKSARGEQSVAAQAVPLMVNRRMVNRSAPDLFPPILIPKKSFIRRETRSAALLVRTRSICSNLLKTNSFLSLIKCPLNRIKCRNFFIYWDEQKSVKYVSVSRINACARPGQLWRRRRRCRPVRYFSPDYQGLERAGALVNLPARRFR